MSSENTNTVRQRLLIGSLRIQLEGGLREPVAQLLDLLEAGSIGEVVVDSVMQTLLPQLTDAKIRTAARQSQLEHYDAGQVHHRTPRLTSPARTNAWGARAVLHTH